MGEDPNRIREQIEQTRRQMSDNHEADQIRTEIDDTRAQMSETVGALGHKADVKTRVKDSISDKKDSVVGAADSLVTLADPLVRARVEVPSRSPSQPSFQLAARWRARRQ